MTSDKVRAMIREVLGEELGKLRAAGGGAAPGAVHPAHKDTGAPGGEAVVIASDADLKALVQKVAGMCASDAMRAKIARGEYVFTLRAEPGGAAERADGVQTEQGVVRLDKGFLSERQIENLPAGTRVVQLGRAVRFTPLARDRLRQRKIAVERI